MIKDYTDLDEFIECFREVADLIKDSNEKDSVSVYGNAEFIYSIFKILITEYEYEIGFIDFARFYYNDDYSMEYSLKITTDSHIRIEKARNINNDYKPYSIFNEIACFYQEDCEQDLVDTILNNDSNMAILFGFENNEDEDELPDDYSSESTHIARDDDNKILGFSKYWTTIS